MAQRIREKISVYNTKKLSWPGFDIISLGYDHIPKSVTCAFLASPLFSAGLFLHGISPLFLKHYVYCQHIQTQGVCETMCTLHGISNVFEHRSIDL